MSIPQKQLKVNSTRLPYAFYAREAWLVARELLGMRVLRWLDGQWVGGSIVEAEAYTGMDDAASHAYRGRTARNAPMFGRPGHTYLYFVYGMHWMFNIAAHPEGAVGAVLIRALAPEWGVEVMQAQRGGKPLAQLTNGPARLAQALALDATLNAVDLCAHPDLTLTSGCALAEAAIACGPRVRVPGDAVAQARPWRFWIRENPYVSH
ncbi:MAG TPA: DNA-3-methyladenine glycosylase [Anaerolineae bacterium]|nr:DNA-3-methyladenine glycosylase [Anaerolineae bacterium]